MTEYIIEQKSQELLKKIKAARPEINVTGTTYYVSADGDDNNDGLSPETPWKTLERVDAHYDNFNTGDAVLFRCGDIFRGSIKALGLLYASYGEGEKPQFYSSPFDAAGVEWKDEGNDVYSIPFGDERGLKYDAGNIIFNHGDAGCGYKKFKKDDLELEFDLDFYHNHDARTLYLKSTKGKPNERWNSIEIAVTTTIIRNAEKSCQHIIVDGLVFKYCGGCGIDLYETDWVKDVIVRNCEFEWIGGSLMPNPAWTARMGNAFEIWGGCENVLIENCYFNQVYDAAASPQWFGVEDNVCVTNFIVRGCLFERNTYDIEYFLSQHYPEDRNKHVEPTPVMFTDMIFEDNICRRNGYGFGSQRPRRVSSACIKGWTHQNQAKNFIIRNNIFDRADYLLVEACADKEEWLPELSGNVYCQYLNKSIIDYNGKVNMSEGNVPTSDTFKPEKGAVIIVAHRPIDELNRY